MKTIKSELEDLKLLASALDADVNDCINLNRAIQIFASDTKLKGVEFEQVRAILNKYSSVVKKRQEAALRLKEGIMAAANHMIAYMEEFTELDDAQQQEIKRTIDVYESTISSLEYSIYSIYNTTHKTKESKNAAYRLISWYRQTIDGLNSELPKLRRQYAKLVNLSKADSTAYNKISSGIESLNEHKSGAAAIQPCSLNIVI